MKKLALSSLIAVFAVSGANAASVIDNPLYMPKANHFYSVTDLSSHSENTKTWKLNEDFGYGITNKLAINVSTDIDDERSFDQWAWGETKLGLKYRALDEGAWKMDLIGEYGVDSMWPNHRPMLEEIDTVYTWTAGVRGGYTTSAFSIAGKALFEYTNTESFNWNEKAGLQGAHSLILGVDGQFALCDKLQLVAGVEYEGRLDDNDRGDPAQPIKNEGEWRGTFGVNYDIDATKYVGLYIRGDMDHKGGVNQDEWDVKKGYGFGAKFGIDF